MGGASRRAAEVLHIGRYTLHGEIASGGMASVHFGKLTGKGGFERAVAIKRLHPHLVKDPEFRAVILDEARLAARVRHPNVVQPLDVIDSDGEVLLVMEYVHGESLSRLIRKARERGEPVPLPICATIMSNVLHGLHSAHEAKDDRGNPLGIVHRDVSPQNVIVGTDGIARVIDFGIAKARTSAESTQEGQVKGKVPYLAPEQIAAQPATQRTDIYAASVMFWELIVGRRLFTADQDQIIIALIAQGNVEPPGAFVEGVPIALDDLVLRGLARDPMDRFSSAREMALLLESILPLAPPSTVGDWVEELARDSLKKRAAQLSDVEQLPPSPDTLRALEDLSKSSSTPSLVSAIVSTAPKNAGSSSAPPAALPSTKPPPRKHASAASVRLPKAGELAKPAVQIPNVDWRPTPAEAQAKLSAEAMPPPAKHRTSNTIVFMAIVVLAVAGFIYALPTLIIRSYVRSAALQGINLSIERVEVSAHDFTFYGVKAEIPDLPGVQFEGKSIQVELKEFAPERVLLREPSLSIAGGYSDLRVEFTKWAATHHQALSLPETLREFRIESGRVAWAEIFGKGTALSSDQVAFSTAKETDGAFGDTFHVDLQLVRMQSGAGVFGPYRAVVDGSVDHVTTTLRLNPGKSTDASIRFVYSFDGAHVLQAMFTRVPLVELGFPIAPLQANVDFEIDASVVVVQPKPGEYPQVVKHPVTGKIAIELSSDAAKVRAKSAIGGDLSTAITFAGELLIGRPRAIGGSATFGENALHLEITSAEPGCVHSPLLSFDSRQFGAAVFKPLATAPCAPPRK